jgi:hypothetical protein
LQTTSTASTRTSPGTRAYRSCRRRRLCLHLLRSMGGQDRVVEVLTDQSVVASSQRAVPFHRMENFLHLLQRRGGSCLDTQLHHLPGRRKVHIKLPSLFVLRRKLTAV